MEKEKEREHLAEFMRRHQAHYDELVKIFADCIERDDVREISLHILYLEKIIQQALNLRLLIQQQDRSRGGNA